MDESIHLCSAVQLAGFPSVIGSLWNVVDAEAAQVAVDVYSWMLKGGTTLQTHKSAESLHDAVLKLRERTRSVLQFQRGNLSDPLIWATYVHVGV
jgi:CHAT domain-containing protein